ncbi:MAG: hypothetical protein M3O71_11530 [Bacteroidota bacterium]|nr:hypothetical protein [Bacteroidota bacterium]
MEIPYTGRAIITENFDGIDIVIPAKRNTFLMLFLGLWLCGWVAGESFGLSSITGIVKGVPDIFGIVWICGWTVGGFFAIRMFWWNLAGKEIIRIGQGVLSLDKKGLFFFSAKTYDLNEAKNFRAEEEYAPTGPFGNNRNANIFNAKNTGTIKFDYGMETVKFGDSIYEAEANFILQKLRDKKYIK